MSARATLTVTLPLRLRSLKNLREHWARRAARTAEHKAMARMMLATQKAWPLRLPVSVRIVRIAPRELDDDNVVLACSAVRDGVALALGVDDRDRRVRFSYGQRKGAARQYAVEIRVEEV